MFNLGDVILRLLLGDDSQFRQQVAASANRAADDSAKTLGSRIKGALGTALGAGLGVAFTGAVDAASQFQDELRTINTVAGLTDDELAKVGDGIQEISRRTGKSLQDLTGGFYDLVSAGVPADKAMQVLNDSSILATGALGTTAEAVDVVTSAMNAFGIDASKSAHVTDVLAKAVADGKTTLSGLAQGFSRVAPIAAAAGISFEEVEAATAKMTLKGASASQAYTDITSSINALLTPNATLNDLQEQTGKNFANIARQKGLAVALDELRQATKGNNEEFAKALGSSEALTFALSVTGENAASMADELNRVQKSSEDGGTAMGQFAEKMKSPIEQGKILVANVQSFLVTVGAPFVNTLGPAIFALNQLGSAFGLSGIGAKIAGGIIGGFGSRVIGPLVRGITGAFGAAEIGTRLETLGLKASTAWIKGMTKVDALTNLLRGPFDTLFGKLGETSVGQFITRFLASSGLTGLAARAAALIGPVAIAATVVLVGGQVAQGIQDANTEDLRKRLTAALNDGSDAAIEDARKHLADLERGARASHNDSWLNIILGQKADFEAQAVARVKDESQFVAGVGVKAMQNAGIQTADGFASGLFASSAARAGVTIFAGKVKDDLASAGMAKEGHRQGNLAGAAVAQGIQEKRDAVDQSWQSLLDAIKNATTPTKERAKLLGYLASTELANGLKSGDPAVRAQAQATKQTIIDRLNELGANTKNIGSKGMEELRKAMHSKDPDIRNEAQLIYNAIKNKITPIESQASRWGANIGQNIANALLGKVHVVYNAAQKLAGAMANVLQVNSPAKEGPLSHGGGPEGWGNRFGSLLAKGILDTVRYTAAAANALAAAAIPTPVAPYTAMTGFAAPRGSWAASGAFAQAPARGRTGDTVINVKVDGLLKARDPLELGQKLARYAQTGVFNPTPEPS